MVVTELSGGLGNQMFQYAFGLATARRNEAPLFLDLRPLEKRDHDQVFTIRDYSLGIFNIEAERLMPEHYAEADSLKAHWSSKLFKKAWPSQSQYVVEDSKRYRADYLKIKAPVFLSGFWQNPRYFTEYKDLVREHFEFLPALSQGAQSFKDKISNTSNSVSLHIRRGDYLRYSHLQGICTDKYYSDSIRLIAEKYPQLEVFVFSDDPAWVKENMKLEHPMHVVELGEGAKDYEDMWLMSLCRHHIIANSSFSWWGAYLANQSGKIVCAPSAWDGKRSVKNIVEEDWKIISG